MVEQGTTGAILRRTSRSLAGTFPKDLLYVFVVILRIIAHPLCTFAHFEGTELNFTMYQSRINQTNENHRDFNKLEKLV